MAQIKGIDVSKHQGTISWPKVAAAGIKFAIIRCAYGSKKNTPTKDTKFTANIDGALAAGLHVGTYLYSYALTSANARAEAEFVVKQLAAYKGRMAYPVFFDVEDGSQAKLGKVTISAMCEVFCDAVAAAGWRPGIYASLDWCKTKINAATLDRYDLWLAQWSSKPTYAGDVAIWQYSDSGKVSGITGPVDMNWSFVDYAAGGAAVGSGSVSTRPTLRRGITGSAVRELQTALNGQGYSLVVDGAFGSQTDAKVRAFQKAQRLAVDGIVGPATWRALS